MSDISRREDLFLLRPWSHTSFLSLAPIMFEKAKVRGLLGGKLKVLVSLICGLFVFIQLKNRTVIYHNFVSVVVFSHRSIVGRHRLYF
jgi:hypothetical protein